MHKILPPNNFVINLMNKFLNTLVKNKNYMLNLNLIQISKMKPEHKESFLQAMTALITLCIFLSSHIMT